MSKADDERDMRDLRELENLAYLQRVRVTRVPPAPKVIEPASLQVRMLNALSYCVEMAAAGADPAWCLESAARHEQVEQLELARRWLVQLVASQRARAALAGLREGDQA